MAAPKESLLSLGNLTGTEKSTFINARERYLKKRPVRLQNNFPAPQRQEHLRVMHLQQRWQELMERERKSQQHNRQLLQQFEEAQKTLTDMLACNAAMKTIRIEYEKYLEESFPRWQQQLKEKTLAAQKKRMEDYLGSYLEKIEEQVPKSSDRHLLSHGSTTRPQKTAAPQAYSGQGYSDYHQDGSSHLLNTQSSWLTHTQSQKTILPPRIPYQPHGPSQIPPSTFPHPHPFPLHHLHPTPRHPYYHWPRQDQSGWASPQPDYPWSWTAGAAGIPSGSEALWGQLFMEDPPPESRPSQTVEEGDKTSRTPSSKGESGRSSHLSLELDIKPVRLSSRQAESSESGRDSSLASREKRKKRERREKRGRPERTPTSDRERCSSHESSRISSAVVVAAVAVAESSENDVPSEKDTSSRRRMRTSGGVACGSSRSEQVAKKRTRSKGDDSDTQHSGERLGSLSEETKSEKVENQSLNEKSASCGEESGSQREEESESDCVKTENKAAEEREKQESDSSEQSSTDEKDEGGRKKKVGAGDGDDKEKEDSDVEESDDDDDDDVSARKRTDEEVEVEEEDEMEDEGDDEELIGLNRKQGSASSHDEEADEDASEDSDEKIEEDDEGSNDEKDSKSEEEDEHRSDKAGEPEDRDSEDSIISPQEKRPKQIDTIPEEAAEEEDDDESKTGSSNDDSNEFSDEDIENLLAPPEQTEKKEVKDLKAEEEPKATFDVVEILQVKSDGSKTDLQNDSDEFDDFYD